MKKIASLFGFLFLVVLIAIVAVIGSERYKLAIERIEASTAEKPLETETPAECEKMPLERDVRPCSFTINVNAIIDIRNDEAVTEPELAKPNYTEEELVAVTNMLYGEVGAFIFDKNMKDSDVNLLMQEWATVAMNHVKMGIAPDLVSLMSGTTGTGYYIWHPQYGTSSYMEEAIRVDPGCYERCRENAIIALSGQMEEPVPDDVIFADLHPQGSGVYKTYNLDTGYFRSTVYLSFK